MFSYWLSSHATVKETESERVCTERRAQCDQIQGINGQNVCFITWEIQRERVAKTCSIRYLMAFQTHHTTIAHPTTQNRIKHTNRSKTIFRCHANTLFFAINLKMLRNMFVESNGRPFIGISFLPSYLHKMLLKASPSSWFHDRKKLLATEKIKFAAEAKNNRTRFSSQVQINISFPGSALN